MFDLYEPLSEKVKLPAAQFRPRKSPNVSFITDFFLRLDNNTSFDEGIFRSTTAHKDFIRMLSECAYVQSILGGLIRQHLT